MPQEFISLPANLRVIGCSIFIWTMSGFVAFRAEVKTTDFVMKVSCFVHLHKESYSFCFHISKLGFIHFLTLYQKSEFGFRER